MEYNFQEIEARWRKQWAEQKNYHVEAEAGKPKFYVLNMFPYPSGAGLHVGHPLGYIASDIYARYKRQQGFNVLNPMGYDAYGLPAEQYAIQTGQHPEKTTTENIARYREQLDKIGFSFDWDREIRTCDPEYYHWTQWAFQRMFESYYDEEKQQARPISELIERFEHENTEGWNQMSELEQQQMLMNYRIAYLGETMVNWCPKLGTVLANDEVVNGVSERGGYPVEQKKMRQWCLRVSAYSQRLLDGLDTIDWSDSIKETQRNWIGRSEGTEVVIKVAEQDVDFTIFTTRADTMFGVTFFVLAPESELVKQVTTAEQQAAVDEYLAYVAKRTERERQIDHTVTGVFSGAYGINPITGEKCPIYISEYVLAGYGTGAIMAVPAHDSRDYAFAKHFNLPIIPLIEGADVSEESYDAKEGIVMNSPVAGKEAYKGFSLNGLTVKEAIAATKKFVSEQGLGRVKINFRLRDAIFSRQRYWGEPFPVYYKDGMPRMIPSECLPIELPEVSKFLPTEAGDPPLGNATCWAWDTEKRQVVENALIDHKTVFPLELSTMPGFAGSSAYYLRYMDPRNHEALLSSEAGQYWQNVDLYVGGSEHATGHLIYSRFWNKFLFDLGISQKEEPFQKLINQGMIQGWSSFVWRVKDTNTFVSYDMREGYECDPLHADISLVNGNVLDVEGFRNWRPEYKDAEFILNAKGEYIVSQAIEKMSKSKYNVVNPDDICARYGADTLRLYEMFLGPIEQSKPWDVAGIDGCFRFLKKAWTLCTSIVSESANGNESQNCVCGGVSATPENLKTLHKLIKKVSEDIEAFSYNTSIPAFMVAVSELQQQKCQSKEVLEQLITLLAPFCPHFAEEIWHLYGHTTTVCDAQWPKWNEEYLKESNVTLGVQFNGKVRFSMDFSVDATPDQMQEQVLTSDEAKKYLEGMQIVKVVAVPKRIVNVVVKPAK